MPPGVPGYPVALHRRLAGGKVPLDVVIAAAE